MAWPSLAGLQTRLVLLVLLAVTPALALALYSDFEERQLRRAQVHEEALRLARLLSADHERLIEAARQLLTALARLPVVRGGATARPAPPSSPICSPSIRHTRTSA